MLADRLSPGLVFHCLNQQGDHQAKNLREPYLLLD